ncbi:hypothetical protein Q5P01_000321 [Channa striata]|uniref:Uncharacterized protein n=1 Tax=Channa striata TaxID=64152 RepID=A0AA88IL90_CHASR|nr:hypothetical protein Q5P01_000321 [Channa striata]
MQLSERLIKPIRKPQRPCRWLVNYSAARGASGKRRRRRRRRRWMAAARSPQAIQSPITRVARAVPAEKAAPLLVGASWGGAASALSRTGGGGRAEARSVRHLPCEASLPGRKRTGEGEQVGKFQVAAFSRPPRFRLRSMICIADFTENPSGLLPCEESVKIEVPRLSVRAADRPSLRSGDKGPGHVSSPESVPINSSATSTTSTLPFTQVKTEELEQDRVGAARDPSARHKQTLGL